MNKNKKPKLRFPEFSGEWQEKTLGEVVDYENGKPHENNIIENGQYVVVNSKYISSDGVVAKYTDKAYCLAEKGDILMVLSDVPNGKAFAKCFIVDKENKYTVNQRICKISTHINSDFLFYQINRNSYFLNFDDGVKQTNLRKEDVLSLPILLPPTTEEQQKIADCLTSLDELIEAQEEKLRLLKEHKKGLLQQLFPQVADNENIVGGGKILTISRLPKLRFPEFSGEWQEKPLGEVLNYERPDKYIVNNTNYKTSGTPVLTANKSFILGYTDEKTGIF